MTDTTMHADFEKFAEDYCLTDPHQKQDCFFAYQAATERATAVERERAAKVAEAKTKNNRVMVAAIDGVPTVPCCIAAAIRQGGTP